MGWNTDFEVSDVKIIKELDYKVLKRDFEEDVEKLGLRRAIKNVVEHFAGLEQVKSAIGTPDFLEECDKAFENLMNAFRVINATVGPYINTDGYYCVLKYDFYNNEERERKDWETGCIEKMISKNNDSLKYVIERYKENIEDYKQELLNDNNKTWLQELIYEKKEELEGLIILLNFNGNKSVFEIFLRELESLTALYCEQTGKEMEAMRKNICKTAYDYMDLCLQLRKTAEGSLFNYGKLLFGAIFQTVKYNRLENPYTYFLDSIV